MKRKLAVLMVSLCLFFSSQTVFAEEIIDTGLENIQINEYDTDYGVQESVQIELELQNFDKADDDEPPYTRDGF